MLLFALMPPTCPHATIEATIDGQASLANVISFDGACKLAVSGETPPDLPLVDPLDELFSRLVERLVDIGTV